MIRSRWLISVAAAVVLIYCVYSSWKDRLLVQNDFFLDHYEVVTAKVISTEVSHNREILCLDTGKYTEDKFTIETLAEVEYEVEGNIYQNDLRVANKFSNNYHDEDVESLPELKNGDIVDIYYNTSDFDDIRLADDFLINAMMEDNKNSIYKMNYQFRIIMAIISLIVMIIVAYRFKTRADRLFFGSN